MYVLALTGSTVTRLNYDLHRLLCNNYYNYYIILQHMYDNVEVMSDGWERAEGKSARADGSPISESN